MAGKQYDVVVGCHDTINNKGDEKRYEPGDTYSGAHAEALLRRNAIVEKCSTASDSKEN